MYTRGQLAIIGKVGRKALRLYEESGILIPEVTNEQNGYRYYSEDQLMDLLRIKEYRRLGLSLKEIKQILSGKVDEIIALTERSIQLEQEIQTGLKIKDQLDRYRSKKIIDGNEYYEVEENKIFEQKAVLVRTENIELEHLGISVGKLHEIAVQNGLVVTGPHYVRYNNIFDQDGNFTMETCLPVKSEDRLPMHQIDNVATCLYTKHSTGFSSINKAHQKIIDYAKRQQLKLTGKVFEVYNSDMSADVYYEIEY